LIVAVVRLLPEAADDVRALDGAARKLVLKAFKKLEDSPAQRGAALGSKSNAQSDLSGFRKLVVGDRSYRIVYQVRPDGSVVVVWVVGARRDFEVYRITRRRIDSYEGHDKQAILRAILGDAEPIEFPSSDSEE
jgi:mRNA interferase RelE/StbE